MSIYYYVYYYTVPEGRGKHSYSSWGLKTCLLYPWKQWARKYLLTNPSLCMQYRSTHPSGFALGICASILHTNLGSWSITITYIHFPPFLIFIATIDCAQLMTIAIATWHVLWIKDNRGGKPLLCCERRLTPSMIYITLVILLLLLLCTHTHMHNTKSYPLWIAEHPSSHVIIAMST